MKGMQLMAGDNGKSMPLWQHLEELRWVLVKVIVVLAGTTLASFLVIDQMFELLLQPLQALIADGRVVLNMASPFDGVVIRLKSSLMGGVVLGVPAMLVLAWNFIAPGLHRHERRAVWWICGFGTLLFAIGAALGFLTMGKVLEILTGFGIEGAQNIWTLRTYFDFLFLWVLGGGLSFELPLVIVVLVRAGVMEVATLRAGRPYAVVGIFVLAAICTPPDPFTQLLMAVPMCLLFELGLLVASFGKEK